MHLNQSSDMSVSGTEPRIPAGPRRVQIRGAAKQVNNITNRHVRCINASKPSELGIPPALNNVTTLTGVTAARTFHVPSYFLGDIPSIRRPPKLTWLPLFSIFPAVFVLLLPQRTPFVFPLLTCRPSADWWPTNGGSLIWRGLHCHHGARAPRHFPVNPQDVKELKQGSGTYGSRARCGSFDDCVTWLLL